MKASSETRIVGNPSLALHMYRSALLKLSTTRRDVTTVNCNQNNVGATSMVQRVSVEAEGFVKLRDHHHRHCGPSGPVSVSLFTRRSQMPLGRRYLMGIYNPYDMRVETWLCSTKSHCQCLGGRHPNGRSRQPVTTEKLGRDRDIGPLTLVVVLQGVIHNCKLSTLSLARHVF